MPAKQLYHPLINSWKNAVGSQAFYGKNSLKNALITKT